MDVHATMGELIDRWCERRALQPLSILLPTYASLNGLTDGWSELWGAMRHVRAMCKDDLTKHGELDAVNAVVAELSRVLHPGEAPQDVEKLAEQITAAMFGGRLRVGERGGSA